MIGGLRTVMNGHYPIHTNDLLMFYFDNEKEYFETNGSRADRNALSVSAGLIPNGIDIQAIFDYIGGGKDSLIPRENDYGNTEKSKLRRMYYDRANGNFAGKTVSRRLRLPQHRVNTTLRLPHVPIVTLYHIVRSQDQKTNVFYIKPYIASSHKELDLETPQYFPCDKARIFGRAISNAQPYEMVDIQLSRQAI